MSYSLSPKARSDLDGIWDYTAERWNEDQAERYIRQIAQVFAGLADGALRGFKADDIRDGYLMQPVGSHVIFYRRGTDDGIVVVRVLHQRMGMTRHL